MAPFAHALKSSGGPGNGCTSAQLSESPSLGDLHHAAMNRIRNWKQRSPTSPPAEDHHSTEDGSEGVEWRRTEEGEEGEEAGRGRNASRPLPSIWRSSTTDAERRGRRRRRRWRRWKRRKHEGGDEWSQDEREHS